MARVDLRNQLKRLNQQGITILISSHILVDLEEICTRVAFIADGKNQAAEFLRHLVASGVPVVKFDRPPATLEQRYRSVFGGQPR